MTGGDNRIYRSDERMRLQYERMLLCAALRENRDQEVETLRRPRGEEEACAAVFEKSRAHMLARLNRRMLWRAFCEGMCRVAPRAARVTAAAAALLCVGLTAAFAASDAFRVQVYALFAQDYGEFTAIRAQAVPEKAFDVPTEWGGDYYPAYIPEGFEIVEVYNGLDIEFFVQYQNAEGIRLFLMMKIQIRNRILIQRMRMFITRMCMTSRHWFPLSLQLHSSCGVKEAVSLPFSWMVTMWKRL